MRRALAPLLTLLLPALVWAQSLGEVAEREKAKRQKSGAKSYTNEDLEGVKPSPSPSPSPEAPPDRVMAAAAARFRRTRAATPQPPPAEAREPERGYESEVRTGESGEEGRPALRDEQHWRQQIEVRRKAVADAEKRVTELEARIKELMLDANPNSADLLDPNRLQKRDAEYRAKLQELEQAKKAVPVAKQAVADLEEEARQAGVPPGWLR